MTGITKTSEEIFEVKTVIEIFAGFKNYKEKTVKLNRENFGIDLY